MEIHLADAHRTILLPTPQNSIELDTKTPVVIPVANRTEFSPDGDHQADAVTIHFTLSEPAHVLVYLGDRLLIRSRSHTTKGSVTWSGRTDAHLHPPGTVTLSIGAVDLAGNAIPAAQRPRGAGHHPLHHAREPPDRRRSGPAVRHRRLDRCAALRLAARQPPRLRARAGAEAARAEAAGADTCSSSPRTATPIAPWSRSSDRSRAPRRPCRVLRARRAARRALAARPHRRARLRGARRVRHGRRARAGPAVEGHRRDRRRDRPRRAARRRLPPRLPWLLPLAALATVPVRIGALGHQLLVPLYLVILGGTLLFVVAARPRRRAQPRAPVRRLAARALRRLDGAVARMDRRHRRRRDRGARVLRAVHDARAARGAAALERSLAARALRRARRDGAHLRGGRLLPVRHAQRLRESEGDQLERVRGVLPRQLRVLGSVDLRTLPRHRASSRASC